MKSGMPLWIKSDGSVSFEPIKKKEVSLVEMQVCERTECELQMTDNDLFAILRKMGYAIPDDDTKVLIYCTKLAKKASIHAKADDPNYRIKLKWTKVVKVDPKPVGGFIL